MATSRNESVQLRTPKAKAAYTGLYAYSNGFVEAWLSDAAFTLFRISRLQDRALIFLCLHKCALNIQRGRQAGQDF